MAISQKQLDANRRNASLSTGPRTDAGKEASRLNALKHGLRAEHLEVLPHEDADAFAELVGGWLRDLAPADAPQARLIRHAAALSWKLDRAERHENALLTRRVLEAVNNADCADDDARALREAADVASFDPSIEGERLRRYQLTLLREMRRTVESVEKLGSKGANAPNEPISVGELPAPNEPISDGSLDQTSHCIAAATIIPPGAVVLDSLEIAPNEPIFVDELPAPNEPISPALDLERSHDQGGAGGHEPAASAPNEPISARGADAPNEPISATTVSAPNEPISGMKARPRHPRRDRRAARIYTRDFAPHLKDAPTFAYFQGEVLNLRETSLLTPRGR